MCVCVCGKSDDGDIAYLGFNFSYFLSLHSLQELIIVFHSYQLHFGEDVGILKLLYSSMALTILYVHTQQQWILIAVAYNIYNQGSAQNLLRGGKKGQKFLMLTPFFY